MNLRPRLVVTTLGVSVPLVLGLIVWDRYEKRVAAEGELVAFAAARMASPGWLAACDADPQHWRGRPDAAHDTPPPEAAHDAPPVFAPGARNTPDNPKPHREPAGFFGYGANLQPLHPAAPQLPADVVAALRGGADTVALPTEGERVRAVLRVTEAAGPCAYVLAHGTTEPWLGAILPPTRIWLLPLLVVIVAVLTAVGPVIRRIRALTQAVARSAASDYLAGVHLRGDDEVAGLAQAFDAAARRVRDELQQTQRREQALREFLANTTHDVMIPLTVLQGHLSALERGGAGGSAAAGADAGGPGDANAGTLRAAMDEAHYLGSLLHNLSAAARLEAAETDLAQGLVSLSELVERVTRRHRVVATQQSVSLDSAVPAQPLCVRGDVTLLEQAVSNLVYNAVRHNRPGGHVAVVLERSAPGQFCLQVLDDGPGIAPAQLSRLTERGFRGDAARTRAPGGQGLGLHITHEVARRHGLQFGLQPGPTRGLLASLQGPTAPCQEPG